MTSIQRCVNDIVNVSLRRASDVVCCFVFANIRTAPHVRRTRKSVPRAPVAVRTRARRARQKAKVGLERRKGGTLGEYRVTSNQLNRISLRHPSICGFLYGLEASPSSPQEVDLAAADYVELV